MTTPAQEQDVVDVLTEDHEDVTQLLIDIQSSVDTKERRDLADIVITELVRHSVAEEMFVYPVMREHLPNGEEAVEHDIEEHKVIERLLKDLEGLDADTAEFSDHIAELAQTLADHVRDEESEQFPQLRALVPHDRLVEIAGAVATAKMIAPTRPHPMAPNNQAFHLLVGPGVGLVDRIRDKLSGKASA